MKSILIPDQLHQAVKSLCVEKQITILEFVEDAIEEKYNKEGGKAGK